MMPFTCQVDLTYLEYIDLKFLLEYELKLIEDKAMEGRIQPHDKKTREILSSILAKIKATQPKNSTLEE